MREISAYAIAARLLPKSALVQLAAILILTPIFLSPWKIAIFLLLPCVAMVVKLRSLLVYLSPISSLMVVEVPLAAILMSAPLVAITALIFPPPPNLALAVLSPLLISLSYKIHSPHWLPA